MSFVGTRPEAIKYVEMYEPEYMAMIRYNLIWRLSLKNQGRDDHIFLMQFVSGHVYTGPGL